VNTFNKQLWMANKEWSSSLGIVQGVNQVLMLKTYDVMKHFPSDWDGEMWTRLIWLMIGQVVGACDCGEEP
jgi:hypothetical protein